MAVYVIGGGLAGCEAAWQLARRGISVTIIDQKPHSFSPAHHDAENLCELVCSNSLKSDDPDTASGLLKEEMRRLDSLVLSCADQTKVPAGGALAVDRDRFSALVTRTLREQPTVRILAERIDSINDVTERQDCEAVIVATGPLTADALANDIAKTLGLQHLSFYDAAAPLVFASSIDFSSAFRAARYGKGEADYINCPMNREEYAAFYEALISAECADVKDFDDACVYEGCMPVETMARRGSDTLRFGPLKPIGLRHPETNASYYAVVQLRQDNTEATLYNMVGFQTRLKFGEQKRVFGMIPALKNAEFARYGVMHRNTYLQSPGILNEGYQLIGAQASFRCPVFFAGQITGVEGYLESASSGLLAGLNAFTQIRGLAPFSLPRSSMIGALAGYVSGYGGGDFQPMGANFGILTYCLPEGHPAIRDKKLRKRYLSEQGIRTVLNAVHERKDCF